MADMDLTGENRPVQTENARALVPMDRYTALWIDARGIHRAVFVVTPERSAEFQAIVAQGIERDDPLAITDYLDEALYIETFNPQDALYLSRSLLQLSTAVLTMGADYTGRTGAPVPFPPDMRERLKYGGQHTPDNVPPLQQGVINDIWSVLAEKAKGMGGPDDGADSDSKRTFGQDSTGEGPDKGPEGS